MKKRLAFGLVFLLTTAAGCASGPTHPTLQRAAKSGKLPALFPIRRAVANINYNGAYQISPDGKHLLWGTVVGTDAGLATQAVASLSTQPKNGKPVLPVAQRRFATGFRARPPVGSLNYGWLADSRHAWYYKDRTGAENARIMIFDTTDARFSPWEVTPWPGARSYLIDTDRARTGKLLFASNKRNRRIFDLYEADLAARTTRLAITNDGSIRNWVVDHKGRLAGRWRQTSPEDGADKIFEINSALLPGPEQAGARAQQEPVWQAVRTVGGFDYWRPSRLEVDKGLFYAISNLGRDKSVLLRQDIATGAETVLFEHPEVDVRSGHYQRADGPPFAVVTAPGYPEIAYLDTANGKAIARDIDAAVRSAQDKGLLAKEQTLIRPSFQSDDGQQVIVRAYAPLEKSEWLLDRTRGELIALRLPEPDVAESLVPHVPFSFTASDGLKITGYVLRPKGTTGPTPLILLPHGGPWTRDYWRSARFGTLQLLANRGYAVMQVNYRGSAGFGREFLNAAVLKAGTRLQQDIAEAAQWAVDQGIADRDRLAVLGGSFGGYSVLMQLIDKPHPYSCGVDIVGVANWPRQIENHPPYWRAQHYYRRFYGDINNPTERDALWKVSPMSRIGEVTAPLLVIHGANDVRVIKQDSDDVVAALKKLKRPVKYMVFSNEGHSIRRWRNKLAMWREIEDFFAQCLGGRSRGFDYYQLMPRW